MEYTKLKLINNYKSENINPAKAPDTLFEMYSVSIFETGHPEFLRGDAIASNKAVVKKNDILLCKINPRINRVWVVTDESEFQKSLLRIGLFGGDLIDILPVLMLRCRLRRTAAVRNTSGRMF